jgi:hypothetical protein
VLTDFRQPAIYSWHDGGAFAAMCDASVRWMPYSTRVIEFIALATREEGDSVEMYERHLEQQIK